MLRVLLLLLLLLILCHVFTSSQSKVCLSVRFGFVHCFISVILNARSMHGPCTPRPHSVHALCTIRAHSVHAQCTLNARSGLCTLRLCPMHFPCTLFLNKMGPKGPTVCSWRLQLSAGARKKAKTFLYVPIRHSFFYIFFGSVHYVLPGKNDNTSLPLVWTSQD